MGQWGPPPANAVFAAWVKFMVFLFQRRRRKITPVFPVPLFGVAFGPATLN